MLSWSPTPAEALAFAAILFAALFAVLWWRAETRAGRRSRARQVRSRLGEDQAEALLAARGFRVIERQVHVAWAMEVDGVRVQVKSRADLLVEAVGGRRGRRRQRFVAEVKTGSRAPDPTHPATRRQLLEYLHAFEVDGVLLVDMEARRVLRVSFPPP